ncbi:hypothetical protein J2Y45_003327 [Dyadobacter sp. BE34]|uniref:TonB C-terminal domain-containing protein n=1 Tax=Dyadobacter fermentans TaxID=94254 RepID=A0ABU1QZH4_9BACT|nr:MULTISPECIES: hypothetical protein [Dyadobacter]MDR6806135.1 hypothetical protein [Dyadobacter fermentans]MDR7043876.1 hypothetical protein [Dyadobacter sp. BE242]MDR7198187.1 hypothetical protein [Dyadobacter sp. BE34]MDR7216150.1 hypothetical protein [Dyadobacter sp. BE31]MDR7264324.1 hypothetical protein [Dyadobacter sp. BE32]
MAATNDHTPDFEDFERYCSGEMPPAEQRLLEGRMLAEPLLAEAYDGFLAWRERDGRMADTRAELRERLNARVRRADRNTLPLWAYASAASVLLAVFSYWFVFLRDQPEALQKPSIAVKREEIKSLPAAIVPKSPAESASVLSSAPLNAPHSNATSKPKTTLTPSGLADAKVQQEENEIALEDSSPIKTEEIQAVPQPSQVLVMPSAAQAVGRSVAGREKMEREKADTQYLVASKPVSANAKTYTVTVPGDTMPAAPALGWADYRTYLEKNTGSASTTGQIVVTFSVSSTGTLSDFVTNGPEQLYKEAIRIISSGPAWAPARRRGIPVTSRAEIRLQFRQAQ